MSSPAMKTILHVLTRPEDPLADAVIAAQSGLPETRLESIRLTESGPPEQYRELVAKAFAADSVQVW